MGRSDLQGNLNVERASKWCLQSRSIPVARSMQAVHMKKSSRIIFSIHFAFERCRPMQIITKHFFLPQRATDETRILEVSMSNVTAKPFFERS